MIRVPDILIAALFTLVILPLAAQSQNMSPGSQVTGLSIAEQIAAEKAKASDYLQRSFSAAGADKVRLLALATYHKCLADRLQPGAGATKCTDPNPGNTVFPGFAPNAEQQEAANNLALLTNFFALSDASAAASKEKSAQKARSHSERGLILMREGRWAEATKSFGAAAELHPLPTYQAALATALIRSGRPLDAFLAAQSAAINDRNEQRYAKLRDIAAGHVAALPDTEGRFAWLGREVGPKYYRSTKVSQALATTSFLGLIGGLGYWKWKQAAVPEAERPTDYDAFSAQGPGALRGMGLGYLASGVALAGFSMMSPDTKAVAVLPVPESLRKTFERAALRAYRTEAAKKSLLWLGMFGAVHYAAGTILEPKE